jgi:hypothetical protein
MAKRINMTELTKPITRKTAATEYYKAASRNLVVSLEPAGRGAAQIGIRLAGTRQTYRIGINSVYRLAIDRHLQKVEKEAKRLHKEEKLPMRSARARARKTLEKELR